MLRSVQIFVTGRVQGVGFRHYSRLAAEEYGIVGFIRNEPDGSVYIEAQGEEENLDKFIDFCKEGPAWARVDKIIVNDIPPISEDKFITK